VEAGAGREAGGDGDVRERERERERKEKPGRRDLVAQRLCTLSTTGECEDKSRDDLPMAAQQRARSGRERRSWHVTITLRDESAQSRLVLSCNNKLVEIFPRSTLRMRQTKQPEGMVDPSRLFGTLRGLAGTGGMSRAHVSVVPCPRSPHLLVGWSTRAMEHTSNRAHGHTSDFNLPPLETTAMLSVYTYKDSPARHGA
jgi:hypothetical protein